MAIELRMNRFRSTLISTLVLLLAEAVPAAAAAQTAAAPPEIPIGLDAFRQWEKWPYQRIGARAYMRSTYDRHGRNHTADASGFLYQEAEDFNVTLDVEGAGVLYFIRTNHWHGSPWHYEVDGVDHIVQETTTATPNEPVADSVFIPQEPFPKPLTWTWSTTKGADLMWVPIPFEESQRLAYSRTFYGTGYYIYHQYVEGAPLSQPIESWKAQPPDEDVLELINRSGTDIAPTDIPTETGTIEVGDGGAVQLARLEGEPGQIRALKLTLPREQALEIGRARLRITWDDREHASVDAPLALFFGAGILYNRDGREYLVKGFPMNVRFIEETVELACYYPMPFFRNATFELVDCELDAPADIRYEIGHEPYTGPANHVGYFHATYQDHPEPKRGHDVVLLDTRKTEGGGEWSGSFVGTSFIFSHDGVLTTLEGDPRFFFDDSRTPSYGTGTEEWGGGGDYWGGQNMTLPFAGHPTGARNREEAKDEHDLVQSAYRFLVADLFPFGKNALIRLEHGGENQSTEHYETVTYWYGLPAASLVQTDALNVGEANDEADHHYTSPDASEPYEITSRYEWGVDSIRGRAADEDRPADAGPTIIYPPHTEIARRTKGASEFTLQIRPDNLGVFLRRTLDYSVPNQRARVFIADASDTSDGDSENLDWEEAGAWYTAGSNTWYHSWPDGELAPAKPVVMTSNRRFRDEEFLIPRRLTDGRSAIRVRVEHTPVDRPLLPGGEIQESAWTEIRYTAWCWIMPDFQP